MELAIDIIQDLYRDTGIRYNVHQVQNVIDTLGIDPRKMAEANSIEQLEHIKRTVQNIGPEFGKYGLVMDKNGKVESLHIMPGGLRKKPEKRVIITGSKDYENVVKPF